MLLSKHKNTGLIEYKLDRKISGDKSGHIPNKLELLQSSDFSVNRLDSVDKSLSGLGYFQTGVPKIHVYCSCVR